MPGCASEMASQREASSSEGIAWREPDSLLGVAAGVLPRHLWLGTADQGSLRRGVRSSCRVCTHAPPPGLAAAHRVDLLQRRVKTETDSVAILAQARRRPSAFPCYAMQAYCMPHTAAATRAVVEAILASSCPVKVATALVAAACRAAAAMDRGGSGPVLESTPLDIAATVADRLELLRPVLLAQAQHGLASGQDCRSPAGLTAHESIVRANVARHAGFNDNKLISEMSAKDLRQLQRGKKKKGHGSPRTETAHLRPCMLDEQSTRSSGPLGEEALDPSPLATEASLSTQRSTPETGEDDGQAHVGTTTDNGTAATLPVGDEPPLAANWHRDAAVHRLRTEVRSTGVQATVAKRASRCTQTL